MAFYSGENDGVPSTFVFVLTQNKVLNSKMKCWLFFYLTLSKQKLFTKFSQEYFPFYLQMYLQDSMFHWTSKFHFKHAKKKKDILVREAFIRWCRGLENVLIKIKFALKFCHLKWSSYLPRPANNFTFFSWYFVTFFSLKNQGAVPLISTYFQTCFWDVGDSVTWCALDLLCKIRYIGKTVLFIQNCLAVGFWLVSHLC